MTATPSAIGRSSRGDHAWVARFERLLTDQIELCKELTGLARSQRDCIGRNDPDELLGVLGRRQAVIERLRSIAEEARPLREQWSGGLDGADERVVARVRRLISELTDMMRTIAENDAEDRKRMERSRDDLAGRLAGVAKSRGAISAYGVSQAGGPRFQDREG